MDESSERMSFFGHLDYFAGLIMLVALLLLMVTKRLPTPEGFEHFLTSLNSKGGNILILSFFTYVSLQQTIRWLYHIIEMVELHHLNESNAIATLGIQFLTTTAFGMFAGALISTLTGIATKPPVQEKPNDVPQETR
jgi:hypothetical protein